MAVSVHVPCRVLLDAETAAGAPEEVVRAFAAGAGRAVAAADREVLAPRGAVPVLAPGHPVFTWTGEHVSPRVRADVEARLRMAVLEMIAARIPAPDLPPPLSDPPAERYDPDRHRTLLGTYLLPSYNDSGQDTDMEFLEPMSVGPRGHEWRTVVAGSGESLAGIGQEAARQWGAPPKGSARGLIMKQQRAGRLEWLVFLDTTPPTSFRFPEFGEMVYSKSKRAWTPDKTKEPQPGPGTAERRVLTDRDGLIAVVDEVMGPSIRADIRSGDKKLATMSEDEYTGLVEAAAAKEVAARVDEQMKALDGEPLASLIIVRVGGGSALIMVPRKHDANLHWTGVAQLLPVTDEFKIDPKAPKPSGSGGGGPGGKGDGTGDGSGGEGGEGNAEGDGDGSGKGGGSGDGTGGGRPPRAFVFDPTAPTTPGGEQPASRFPLVRTGGAKAECKPLNGEPPLTELGEAGEAMRRRIDDIAFRLQIKPCYFAANFAVTAAGALQARARDISTYITASERDGFTQPVPEGTGTLGPIAFHPVASPAIQFLRHLAGVVPSLHGLARMAMDTYGSPQHWPKVKGGWIDSPASWSLHFLHEFTPAMEHAVAEVFVSGCQAVFLQLVLASRTGIQARLDNFERYAPIFERLMVSQLSDYAELQRLRTALSRHGKAAWVQNKTGAAGGDVTAALSLTTPATAWFGAARALSGAFLAAEQATTTPGTAGEIVTTDGVARVRDSHGVMWTEAEIENALVMLRGEAEGIDPLVKQIKDVPDVLERFERDRGAIKAELRRVLNDMRSNNAEMLDKARADAYFAFRASTISEHITTATVPGSSYALQGVHLQVHQQLGEFFGGSSYYAVGLDHVFNVELGKRALTSFGIMVGLTLLSVLCPPLGIAAGVAVGGVEVVKAQEKDRIFGAFVDPELVITRAEVEMELFAAYLGLALSLVPVGGRAASVAGKGAVAGVRSGLKSGLRQGLKVGARVARRQVVTRWNKMLVEAAKRDVLTAFVTELSVNVVLDRVIEQALSPILAAVEHELMLTSSVGGPKGARFVMMVLESGREKP